MSQDQAAPDSPGRFADILVGTVAQVLALPSQYDPLKLHPAQCLCQEARVAFLPGVVLPDGLIPFGVMPAFDSGTLRNEHLVLLRNRG
jgi:hypothetical protein